MKGQRAMDNGSKPIKVWGVTRGSYSDYRVQAVFASKTDAERHIAIARGTTADIWNHPESVEEFLFYPEGVEPRIVTEYSRQCNVWDDGTVSEDRFNVREEWEYDPLFGPVKTRPTVRWVRAPIHQGKGGRLEVRGSDEEAVQKAFSDNLVQRIAAAEQGGDGVDSE